MRQILCDKCGKTIHSGSLDGPTIRLDSGFTSTIDNQKTTFYDLCVGCKSELFPRIIMFFEKDDKSVEGQSNTDNGRHGQLR